MSLDLPVLGEVDWHVKLSAALTQLDTTKQVASALLTSFVALAPIESSILQYKTGAWSVRTPTQVKADMLLDAVENTADIDKPVSTATQTALDGKMATGIAGLPAGSLLVVAKTGGIWPGGSASVGVRPTTRTDLVVAWKGADPSPAIVASGNGGMLDNVDVRWVTA